MASKGGKRRPRRQEDGGHNVKLSKLLSYTLRHGAIKDGLNISSSGFVSVQDILAYPKFAGYSVKDIEEVVNENDKKRFSIGQGNDADDLLIRANQGHSLSVPDLELVKLELNELPTAIHGTYEKCVDKIKEMGLSRMGRSHIHMAVSEPGESGVISGMRKSCDFIIVINIARAQADGLEFFRSANNVILSEGNADGVILPNYFDSVKPRK